MSASFKKVKTKTILKQKTKMKKNKFIAILAILIFAICTGTNTYAQTLQDQGASVTGTTAAVYKMNLPIGSVSSIQLVTTKTGTPAISGTVIVMGSNDNTNWDKYDITGLDTLTVSTASTNDLRFVIPTYKWKYTALKINAGATGTFVINGYGFSR